MWRWEWYKEIAIESMDWYETGQVKPAACDRLSLEFSQLQFFNAVQAVKTSMGNSFYTTPIQCLVWSLSSRNPVIKRRCA